MASAAALGELGLDVLLPDVVLDERALGEQDELVRGRLADLQPEPHLGLELDGQRRPDLGPGQEAQQVLAYDDDQGPLLRPSGAPPGALDDAGPASFLQDLSGAELRLKEPGLQVRRGGEPAMSIIRQASAARATPSCRFAASNVAAAALTNGCRFVPGFLAVCRWFAGTSRASAIAVALRVVRS
jgi:hypothetical protein